MKSTTPFNEAVCEAIMKALNTNGRGGFSDCLTGGNDGQCGPDPGGCVDGIKE
jgi:hypothetical protein